MDASQIVNQNLSPMLDAIRSYGRQLAEEKNLQEQRDYQRTLRNEERTYQEGVREKARTDAFTDDAKRRRIENERKVLQAFPGLNIAGMSDAQLESKSLEATRKISFDDTLAKSDAQIRADAQNYGIKDFATAEITSLRKLVSDAKIKEAVDAETQKKSAVEAYEDQRLASGSGAAAAQAYADLANQRADLLREFAVLSKRPDDMPVDKVAIGRRAVQLMSGGDPLSASPDDMEIGSKLFAMMNDPKNKDMKALILDPILRGETPSNDVISRLIPDPMQQMYLLGLNARALRDVNAIDPKMLQAEAAVNRNSVYSQKFLLGDRLSMLDSSMRQLTEAYPSLKKRPNVNIERLTTAPDPGDPTKVRGGSSLPALPAPASPAGAADGASTPSLTPREPSAPAAADQSNAVRGLFPFLKDYLSEAPQGLPSMPVFREGASEFGSNASAIGSGISSVARAVPPLLFGGNMPPAPPSVDPVQMLGGGVKMAVAPFEALTGVMKYTDAARSVPGADQPIRPMAPTETPDQYRAYLNALRTQQYNPNRFFGSY